MLKLRHNTIWLGLAMASLWACGDDDTGGDKTTADSAVEVPDGGGDEQPDAEVECTPKGADGVQDEASPGDTDSNVLPIVFVHGFVGSASQFDSQAQRLAANGYPPSKLYAYDHDGVVGTPAGFADGLDTLIDTVLAKHNAKQIFLIGHSRGTSVSNEYLYNPDPADPTNTMKVVIDPVRSKKVAKVVLLDGRPCNAGVPCDAPNQAALVGQAHVEVATSAESFKRWYKFLLDKEPTVVDIVKQDKPVKISGRAVNFPANTGRTGATLDVFEINPETGARVGCSLYTQPIPESGDWGPVTVDPTKHYELLLAIENGSYQHFYFQRFLRSTKFVRLLSGGADSASRVNTNAGPGHAALTVLRMREWYPSDTLNIKLTSPEGDVDVGNAITEAVAKNRIALYLHDDAATPKMTTLAPLPYFSMQPFQGGFDVYIPASTPTVGVTRVTNHPRGDAGKPQVLTFPSWASDKHTTMVMFADFAQ